MSAQARPRALTDASAASSSATAAAEIGRIQSVDRARSRPCQAADPVSGFTLIVLMMGLFYKPRGTRPATARTCRGAASQIAAAEARLAPIESQNAST